MPMGTASPLPRSSFLVVLRPVAPFRIPMYRMVNAYHTSRSDDAAHGSGGNETSRPMKEGMRMQPLCLFLASEFTFKHNRSLL